MSPLSEQNSSNATLSIMNIKVHSADFNTIVDLINYTISNKRKIIINYISAYSVVAAEKNTLLNLSLINADLVHPDGIGIWIALKILNKRKSFPRFNWTDCGYKFLEICEEKEWKIFFLGAETKILIKAEKNLKKKYPRLKLVGFLNGYEDLDRDGLVEDINKLNVDILYVGLGTPKQEIWIYNNARRLNCKVIQSVGDLFNLFAEKKIRGPKLFQKIGFEWLFRLLSNPRKYSKRYIIGISRFVIILMKEIFEKKN